MRDRPAGCSTCASSLCGALCGNGRSPAAGIDGLLVAIGRRRGFGAAPAMMVVMRSGTTNTTLAATQRHPCRSGMGTADCARSRSCSESVVAPAALNDHQNLAALIIFAALYARVRRWDADDGTGGAMRGRGRRATAPRFNNCGEAALIIFAALYARVRRWDADDGTGGAMRGRGWRATAPRFNNCGEGGS